MAKFIAATFDKPTLTVDYVADDGSHLLRSGGTIAWRFNNPGNIRPAKTNASLRIGTGKTASSEQAQQVHAVLRAQLRAASAQADRIQILYGGSMNAANAKQLLSQQDIDGGLVGGAALKAADFLAIVASAT